MDPILPIRRALTHGVPPWVSAGATYFITICCDQRGPNQLCYDDLAANIFESVTFRMERGDWYVHLLVLKPDHLHMFVCFARDRIMVRSIQAWKTHLTMQTGIRWQQGFFDHRVRDRAAFEEKASYIRRNPVRAGLVGEPEGWPYVWEPVTATDVRQVNRG